MPCCALPAQHGVEHNASNQRHQTHDERHIPAVPDGKAVLGQAAAHHWRSRCRQKSAHRPGGENTHHQASQYQQLHRHPHPVRRLMGLMRQVSGLGAKEHIDREPQRIGNAEHASHGRRHRQHGLYPGSRIEINGFGKKHLLGDKAVEQRHARHSCARHTGQRGGDRHHETQSRQSPYIARAAFMIDNAGRHEQRSLEGRVIHDVKNGGHCGQLAVQAQQQGNQSQVRNRRIRQQSLQIMLEHRAIAANQQCQRTSAADHPEPGIRVRQHRPKSRQQEHTGLDHGRRVQVSRHRSRRCHGIGKPEMKRKLRTFSQCAQQDKN